jgi:hypothetical protein
MSVYVYENSLMVLTICVYDSSFDNSSRTFNTSQKLSTELSYTQIVRNIQLLADTLNITEEFNGLDDLYMW